MTKNKSKLSKEEIQRRKEESLQEFGTDNRDEIKKMIKELDNKYFQTRCKNLGLCYKNLDRERRWKIIHTIIHRHRIVARQKHALFGGVFSKELTPAEKFLIKLDDAILTKQLSQKNYTSDETQTIIQNIRNKYSTVKYDLHSVNLEDYNIGKDLNVTLLKAKDRYQNALKEAKSFAEEEIFIDEDELTMRSA